MRTWARAPHTRSLRCEKCLVETDDIDVFERHLWSHDMNRMGQYFQCFAEPTTEELYIVEYPSNSVLSVHNLVASVGLSLLDGYDHVNTVSVISRDIFHQTD
jgi:hypothetical protein